MSQQILIGNYLHIVIFSRRSIPFFLKVVQTVCLFSPFHGNTAKNGWCLNFAVTLFKHHQTPNLLNGSGHDQQ